MPGQVPTYEEMPKRTLVTRAPGPTAAHVIEESILR